MIRLVLKWLTGGGLNGLAAELRKAHLDTLNAANNADRIAAQERVNSLALQMAAQTRGQATWLPKLGRFAWFMLFLAYFGKIIVWDKMLGWGATPDLTPQQWWLVYTVMGFYFLRDLQG